MELFFHRSQSCQRFGSKCWPIASPDHPSCPLQSTFVEVMATGDVTATSCQPVQLTISEDKIYCRCEDSIRALSLNLTAMKQFFYLRNGKRVFSFRLIKDDLAAAFETYDETSFVQFYCLLAKYCVLTDFQKHFKVLGRLAGGAFSTVYAGINILSHEEVALKVISKGSLAPTDQHHDEIQILKNEIVILEQLRHWQLSPLIEVYETPDCVVMVLRQASAGNMLQFVQSQAHLYDETFVRRIISCVLQSLQKLHAAGFIHRDIKPQNILFTQSTRDSPLFLADFGLTVHKKEVGLSDISKFSSGTPGFVAPEVLHGDSYDEKCDLFSLGCVFYFLMTGLGLFEGLSPKEIAARTKDSNFIFHKVSKISSLNSPAEDLLKKLLSVDPCTRISALDSLSHPYFQSNHELSWCPLQQNPSIRAFIQGEIRKYWSA